jgi:DNA-binding PadR family transcriptional regulator
LYEEPKNLVAQGLAHAEKTFVGRRARTIYSITPEGRQALHDWLSTAASPPVLECETVVRLIYADYGTKDDLFAAIATVQQTAEAMQKHGIQIAQEYQKGHAPFQERAYLNMLMFDFLWRYSEALRSWAEAAQATIATWQDLTSDGKIARIEPIDAVTDEKK